MTGTEAFLGPAVDRLTGLIFDTAKKAGGSLLQTIGDKRTITKASGQYAQKYESRYGSLKLLGMQQAVPLESVYTAVRFLDELSIRQFESLQALEQAYRQTQTRRFQHRRSGNQNGITVANENQYLMVLGGPGAGKTTFLQKIGLEALKAEKGGFKHRCIPVFLELKQFKVDEIDLRKLIAQEFQCFGFPPSEEFVTKALEQGKLLILLDGLDEVPKKYLNAAIDSVQDFVSRYEKNRFIASCRTAAYRSSFQRFTDIELADFDDGQIKQFIQNWFQSEQDRQSGTAEKCWEILNQPGNAAAKELTYTPLLLTFLCLIYNRSQSFPNNRSTLYCKALNILLEDWAAEKRIQSDEIYQGLNTDLEKVLLSEIAYQGFAADQLFFNQQQLVDHIKVFLADTVDKPKYLNAKAVLDAIATQQGILVERAEDIFSFSHLTLQEYLTAQYISPNYREIEKLVAEHLTDGRWREVFLLVAGLMRSTDELLEMMETAAQKYINTPKLQNLLAWSDQATAGSEGGFNPAVKRAAVLLIARSLNYYLDCDIALALARALDSTLDHTFDSDFDREWALLNDPERDPNLDFELAKDLDCDYALTRIFRLAFGRVIFDSNLAFKDDFKDRATYILASALTSAIQHELTLVHTLEEVQIFQSINFQALTASLKELEARVLNKNQILEVEIYQEFAGFMYQTWLNALQLHQEWVDLSEEEAEALVNYLEVNELIVRCKQAALRVSREKWEVIEGRMLVSPRAGLS